MKNDIHTILLETYFFGYIDRGIDVEETPLFTRAYEGEALSTVVAQEFQLSPQEAQAAIEAAWQEVVL
jgi:hypothetical protein